MTAVTDPAMQPETFVRPWQDLTRGAKWLDNPLDIMFDIDDVIFPTMHSIHDLALAAGLHDGTVKPQWKGWTVYRLPDGTPCPPEVYWDLWSDFAAQGGYLSTPPIPGAAEAMRELYFAGHHIHLVTARGFMAHATDIREWTKQWVEEFGIPWHTLTFARDKVEAQQPIMKAMGLCKGGFDFAVDDSPANFSALWESGVEAFLLDHDHNADWSWPKGGRADYRVSSVPEFAKIVLSEGGRK